MKKQKNAKNPNGSGVAYGPSAKAKAKGPKLLTANNIAVETLSELLEKGKESEDEAFRSFLKIKESNKKLQAAISQIRKTLYVKPANRVHGQTPYKGLCEVCDMRPKSSRILGMVSCLQFDEKLSEMISKPDPKEINALLARHDSGPEDFFLKEGICFVCTPDTQIRHLLDKMLRLRGIVHVG